MEIPYKGYTITPSSERQPDGRWLPVAQLETVRRGIVTPSPPVRASSQEMRAARAEADALAVRMARAWIDANERKPIPDPVGASGGARLPATPPEAGTPVVRPEVAAPRAKATGDRKRPAPAEKPEWADLCQAVGLDSDERVDRLTRVLVVHSLLDRLVTLVLATKIASSRESTEAPDVERALADIASLPMPTRIDLGSALGVLDPAVAESVAEVDRVRHKLAQHRPPRAKPPWDVSDIEELTSQVACDRCVSKAIQAAHGLMSSLRVRWPSPRQ